jgi:hypothetical protein
MGIGDLVRETATGRMGIVERVDRDYFGARQAFKLSKAPPRGHCIRPEMVDIIAPTRDGIRDRVLVCWTDGHPEYLSSDKLEVLSESR